LEVWNILACFGDPGDVVSHFFGERGGVVQASAGPFEPECHPRRPREAHRWRSRDGVSRNKFPAVPANVIEFVGVEMLELLPW
jgi:hypothetical protein